MPGIANAKSPFVRNANPAAMPASASQPARDRLAAAGARSERSPGAGGRDHGEHATHPGTDQEG